MYIQYINRDPHTVIDGKNEYTFNYGEIKDIPENIGRYITSKFKHSFVKIDEDKTIIKNPVNNTLKMVDGSIIFHIKNKNERFFKCALSPAAA